MITFDSKHSGNKAKKTKDSTGDLVYKKPKYCSPQVMERVRDERHVYATSRSLIRAVRDIRVTCSVRRDASTGFDFPCSFVFNHLLDTRIFIKYWAIFIIVVCRKWEYYLATFTRLWLSSQIVVGSQNLS